MKKILSTIGVMLLMTAAPVLANTTLDLGQVDIHGFVSQGYMQSSDYNYLTAETEDGTYDFNEFGLNFGASVNDNLRLGLQLLSRDLGEIDNNEVVLDWAQADYRHSNWLGLRVGQIKKPSGIFNQYRDIDATRTCIFLPPVMYREDARDTSLSVKGAGIYGALPGGLEYQATYGISPVNEDGGVAKVFATSVGGEVTNTDVEPGYTAWLNWNTPLSGLSVGVSTTDFDFTLNADVVTRINPGTGLPDPSASPYMEIKTPLMIETYGEEHRLFSQFRYEGLMLAAEYLWGEHNVDTTVSGMTMKEKSDPESWYLMATYRFCDWFELGTYYGEVVGDTDDRDGDSYVLEGEPKEKAWLNDWAITTRFDINPFWIVKLEAHLMDGLKDVDYGTDPDPDGDWQMYSAKLTYVF